MLTFAACIGLGLAAAIAAVWPWPIRIRHLRSGTLALVRLRRARTVKPARRHRAADAHTGSFSATRILDRMERGEDPLQ